MDWDKRLFNFGFLVTDDIDAINHVPGLDVELWNSSRIGKFYISVNREETFFVRTDGLVTLLMIGHAYNPFTMQYNENEILDNLLSLSGDEYQDYFDQLTGVFFFVRFEENTLSLACDCAGMQGAYYGHINGHLYFSSHCQIIGEICGLNEDPYVSSAKTSKTFHFYGLYLPGDLSSYQEVKRVIPNTYAVFDKKFHIERFYPRSKYNIVAEADYPQTVKRLGELLHNNMVLICSKWKMPAVSLTGGTDSKTTLACAGDVQPRFRYYSYVSLSREKTDAEAARKICENLGLDHDIFFIGSEPKEYEDFSVVDKMIERHYAYLGKANSNDVCKRIRLATDFKYDIEVKSWVSEVARASRYEKYRKKAFPEIMTQRMLTSMFKIYSYDRVNAKRTDKIFDDYLNHTGLIDAIKETGYPWTEFFVWEIVFGGWGGMTLSCEHKISNYITVPYNNRAILDLMLRTPLEKRLHDQLHRDIADSVDPRINSLGIHVVNGNETRLRAFFERVYYEVNSRLPF